MLENFRYMASDYDHSVEEATLPHTIDSELY